MDEYVTQLEGVLAQVLNARDSETVKSATDQLSKVWYKRSETVPALIRILQVHPQPQMRQLAGVEVRKLIPRFWYDSQSPLSGEIIEQIKASLLQDSLKEDSDLVRHTVARIISAIARIDLDDNRWPSLLPELHKAAQDSDVRKREIATYVLYALLDSSDYCAAAAEEPKTLMELLNNTLRDPESLSVRVNSVLALSGLSVALTGADAPVFQQIVPGIIEVLSQCVAANDDKSASQIFESLSELIDSDAALLGPAFGEIIAHMLNEYGMNKTIDPETRVAAMRVVATTAVFRYNRINRMKLAPELTKKLVELVANADDEEEDDDEDEDDITPTQLALQTLETLASRLPPSQVISPLLQLLPSLVHTANPMHLRAGYLAFSATADGAPDFVASETDTLLPWIVQGLRNENQGVRVAALHALCQLGSGAGERLGREHATLIPLVYGILDSAPTLKVCRSACIALGTIMRCLTNEVLSREYLPELVPRLLDVVRSSPNPDLKVFVIQTLGTAAEVAGRNYMSYFQQTVEILEPYVAVPQADEATGEVDPAAAKLASEALGSLSRLCAAVGAETFAPYLEAWMKTALECFTSKDAILREMAPLYIGELAEVYKADFGVFVPHIVPLIYDVLGQEEIMYDDVGLDSIDPDDIDVTDLGAMGDGLKVNSALCLEKEFSLDCLASLWQHVPAEPSLMPFLGETLSQLKAQSEHFYEDVRVSAITGLWRVFQSLPQHSEVVKATWEASTEMLETESDMTCFDTLFELIALTTKQLGASVFPDQETLQLVLDNIFEIVRRKHRVFEEYEDEENEEDQETEAGAESSEAATQLVQTSLELLMQIAKVLGQEFLPLFPQVAELLQPYATSAIDSERENGVGAFADLVGGLQGSVSQWTETLLPAFDSALNDSATGVRSVAAYGVGLLCAASTNEQVVKQAYPQLFPKVGAVLKVTNDDRAVANAAGALARMATRHPDALPAPLPDLAAQLLSALPLKDGYEEYPPVLALLASTQLPTEAKPIMEAIWQQHIEAQQRDALKSVNSLPADDPLGDDVSLQGWRSCAQQLGLPTE